MRAVTVSIAKLSRVDAIQTTLKEVSEITPTERGYISHDVLADCLYRLCGRLGCSQSQLPSQLCNMALGASNGRSVTRTELADALLDMHLGPAA